MVYNDWFMMENPLVIICYNDLYWLGSLKMLVLSGEIYHRSKWMMVAGVACPFQGPKSGGEVWFMVDVTINELV